MKSNYSPNFRNGRFVAIRETLPGSGQLGFVTPQPPIALLFTGDNQVFPPVPQTEEGRAILADLILRGWTPYDLIRTPMTDGYCYERWWCRGTGKDGSIHYPSEGDYAVYHDPDNPHLGTDAEVRILRKLREMIDDFD